MYPVRIIIFFTSTPPLYQNRLGKYETENKYGNEASTYGTQLRILLTTSAGCAYGTLPRSLALAEEKLSLSAFATAYQHKY